VSRRGGDLWSRNVRPPQSSGQVAEASPSPRVPLSSMWKRPATLTTPAGAGAGANRVADAGGRRGSEPTPGSIRATRSARLSRPRRKAQLRVSPSRLDPRRCEPLATQRPMLWCSVNTAFIGRRMMQDEKEVIPHGCFMAPLSLDAEKQKQGHDNQHHRCKHVRAIRPGTPRPDRCKNKEW
jgi:hypothetical protein